MKRNIPTLIAAGILVIILLSYMVTYQVRYTETVLVTTFGKPSEPKDRAGVYMKWPWPVQRVIRFDKREHIVEGVEEELRTQDEQNLVVLAYAGWKIEKPLTFLGSVRTVKEADRQLWRLLDTHKKTVVGHYNLSQFVSRDTEQIRIEQIEKEILDKLRADALEQFGIDVTMVGIKRLSLPAATTEKVFARMRAEQDNLVTEFRAEGESAALKIISEAESARERILAHADRLAQEIRGEGIREAAKLMTAFKANKEFATFLDELDYLEKIDRAILILGLDDAGTRLFSTDGKPIGVTDEVFTPPRAVTLKEQDPEELAPKEPAPKEQNH